MISPSQPEPILDVAAVWTGSAFTETFRSHGTLAEAAAGKATAA